jgi:hypothetical protein
MVSRERLAQAFDRALAPLLERNLWYGAIHDARGSGGGGVLRLQVPLQS